MPSINTLVKDMEDVIEANGGWDETISAFFRQEVGDVVDRRLRPNEDDGPFNPIRLSGMGHPCKRKLWYSYQDFQRGVVEGEPLRPHERLKFLYGDILEALLISLAKAAGHTVEGEQDELYVAGVRGHRDCVIDGITVDIKSASSFSYKKFQSHGLRDDDPFGYISQLSSYVYAGRTQTDVDSHPTLGAFLVVDKQHGHICLDMYDLNPECEQKEETIRETVEVATGDTTPPRAFEPVPDGKSGNTKLGVNCSYCKKKQECWPGLRTFLYSTGPRYLTRVGKVPNVPEVT